MKISAIKWVGLSVLSATLFSIPWLVPCCGWLLLVAWIPLLWVEADFSARQAKGCWKYYALTFLLWNVFTTYWICKATLGGGITAVIGNAFQMFLVFALFRWVKRLVGAKIGYIFLPTLWIADEYFFLNVEISWPWLVLGNGFADTTFLIQWYDYTGVLGGTLWVFLINLLLFMWIRNRPSKVAAQRYLLGSIAALLLLPVGISLYRYFTFSEVENPIEVVVLQPNIDPYHEKFEDGSRTLSQEEQDDRLLENVEQAVLPSTRYIFAPETFVSYVSENNMLNNTSFLRFYQFLNNYPYSAFVVGAVSAYYYPPSKEPPTSTARARGDHWYDHFNSAFQLSKDVAPFVYHKSKLVPGAENLPYVQHFKFLKNFIIDLGGAMGSFAPQSEADVFPAPWNTQPSDSLPKPLYIGVAICYESAYGEYFASYVKKGAGFMAVITNDGWWGKTPGYRQHLSYSRLRAIETRRSIARSANTGISTLVNQRGDYLQKSEWWTKGWLRGEININHKLTFYVRYGDLIGRISVYLLLLLLVYGVVFTRTKRK